MGKLLSYKGDTGLKDKFVKEIKWHQDQDKIIKGTYSQGSGASFKTNHKDCPAMQRQAINKIKGELQ